MTDHLHSLTQFLQGSPPFYSKIVNICLSVKPLIAKNREGHLNLTRRRYTSLNGSAADSVSKPGQVKSFKPYLKS
ncbi:hypothetical protein CSA37_00460 [Candidatus Fermentibacteria bacterium]|nr:MAG: hypothetical protein CSA37_00460 [Candidatus Fermentibacteria bacterium]